MRIPLGGLLLVLVIPAQAAECVVRSGPASGVLVELYTSEGCDSCPPADRWLSSIGARRAVVPVAFHVDYWDYLGWTDAYADPRYSERQRQMAKAAGARVVYTPQVMIGGRDFSAWRSAAAFEGALSRAESQPPRASIEIAVREGVAHVSARVAAPERTTDLQLHVALTQDNVVTQVRAGENRGATLRHDFVVRDFRSLHGWKDGAIAAEVPLARFPAAKASAFVQNRRTGEVLQALRGC